MSEAAILLTGFAPYGTHRHNPSEEVAKAFDGRRLGRSVVRALTLPVDHAEAWRALGPVLAAASPHAVVHLGLAPGRARIALERVALNVMDYDIPDAAGYRAQDEPCVPGGPAAYFSTLPLAVLRQALAAEGIPAYVSNTAGTYLCNQTLYRTLHAVATGATAGRPAVGFVHLPLLPSMVAEAGLDQPSMDVAVMLRALEVILRVVAA